MPDSKKKRAKLSEIAPLRIPADYQEDQYDPVGNFLQQTSVFETGGGKYMNHPVITDPKSLQYGQRAIGEYGLMPKTVSETINRGILSGKSNPVSNKIDKPEEVRIEPETIEMYSTLVPGMDTKDKDFQKKLEARMGDYLKTRPQDQEVYAERLAEHLLKKTEGEEGKAHYLWNMGHNKNVNKMPESELEQSKHYRKWKALKDIMSKKAKKKGE